MDERSKERFRAAKVHWTLPSPLDRRRAVAMSDRTGAPQLYAWDVAGSELRQLTDRPGGTVFGQIGGDGRHVLYLDDHGGDERGHWVRVPFEGGPPEDLTPDLPPYGSFDLTSRRGGSEVLFTTASESGHETWLVAPDAAPERRAISLHRTTGLSQAAGLTPDGSLAFIRANERTGLPRFSLSAIEVATGRRVGELWDGPDSTIDDVILSPSWATTAPSAPATGAASRARSSGTRRPANGRTWRCPASRVGSCPATGRWTAARSCSA